jgi:hypothetical protein
MMVRTENPDGSIEVRTFELGQSIFLNDDSIHAKRGPHDKPGKICEFRQPRFDQDRFVYAMFEGMPIPLAMLLSDFTVSTEREAFDQVLTDLAEKSRSPRTQYGAEPLWP